MQSQLLATKAALIAAIAAIDVALESPPARDDVAVDSAECTHPDMQRRQTMGQTIEFCSDCGFTETKPTAGGD